MNQPNPNSIWDNYDNGLNDDELPPPLDHIDTCHGHSHSHDLETKAFGTNPLLWPAIGAWNTLVNTFNAIRKLYGEYWVPFLFAFGKYAFGGRENAGKVSKWSKMVRITAMAVSLVSLYFLVDLMSFSEFKAAGAEAPLWSANGLTTQVLLSWIGFAAMSLNMLAVFVGSSANHNKIQQYMEKRAQLGFITGEDVACGMHDTAAMKRMNYTRYAHDLNGAVGTALSTVVLMAFGFSLLGMNMGIGSATLFNMFVARTVSFVLSVTLAPFTGRYRLNEYKNDLTRKMEGHMDKNTAIRNSVNSVFPVQEMSNEMKLFKFSCYRACEKHFNGVAFDEEKIKQAVAAVKDKYIQHNTINKDAIAKTVGMRVPFIDALNFIQLEVEAMLKNKSSITFMPESNPAQYGSSARLLFGAMQLHQDKTEFVNKCKKDQITHLYEVDTDKASSKISTHGIDARAAIVMETDFVRRYHP